MKKIFFLVIFVFGSMGTLFAEDLFPKPDGYVLDEADLLTPQEEASLEASLQALEDAYTAEYAIALLPNLQGRDLEGFANGLFREWGLGQKDSNNGLLLLVDLENRGLRFEVGYGLEGVIPDSLAYQIIEETLQPGFREQGYAKALQKSVDHVGLLLQGEPLPQKSLWYYVEGAFPFFFVLFLALFNGFLIITWTFVRKLSETKHWWPGALLGLFFSGILGFFFLTAFSLWTVLAIGTIAGAFMDIVLSTVLQKPIAKYGPRVDAFLERHGMTSVSIGGGGFGGGGGGFGGGSSGGGGASGSW